LCGRRKPECDLQLSRINKPLATVELGKPNFGHFKRNHTALRTPLERPQQSKTTVHPKLFLSCYTHAYAKGSSKINQSKKLRRLHPPFQAKEGSSSQPKTSKSGAVCMVELRLNVRESKLNGLGHPISGNNRGLKGNRVWWLPCGEAPCLLRP
jgi:hypothetical protein